jgi:hypothetical protein
MRLRAVMMTDSNGTELERMNKKTGDSRETLQAAGQCRQEDVAPCALYGMWTRWRYRDRGQPQTITAFRFTIPAWKDRGRNARSQLGLPQGLQGEGTNLHFAARLSRAWGNS